MSKGKPIYTQKTTFKHTDLFNQMVESAWRISKHESKAEFVRNAIAYYCVNIDEHDPILKVFGNAQEFKDFNNYLKRPFNNLDTRSK